MRVFTNFHESDIIRSLYNHNSISILDFIKANPHSTSASQKRDIKEKRWLDQLHTAVPRGLNLMDSFQGNLW